MSKKTKIVFIILIILLIIALIGIVLKATIFNPWIKNSNYLYDSAVKAVVAEEKAHSPDKQVSGFNTFAASHGFGIQKGSDPSEKIVYIWINYQSYYIENDQIWKSTGASYPYKCYFINDEFVKYEIPDTSNNYQSEIRRIFPEKIANDIINYNSPDNLQALADNIKQQINNYEGYQNTLKDN